MTKNPYINALVACGYIIFIVLVITYGPAYVRNKPDTIMAPITVLSVLVLSVAFMGYIFFFQPIQMYLDGQKSEAVKLFTKTLLSFAVITLLIVIITFTA